MELHPRLWKPGWQKNALTHEVADWYDIETSDTLPAGSTCFDEVITCLLNRIPVAAGLDWWGHLVCFLDPIILPPGTAPANTPDGSTVGVLAINSWGVDWPTPGANGLFCLTEDLATPDGAAAPSRMACPLGVEMASTFTRLDEPEYEDGFPRLPMPAAVAKASEQVAEAAAAIAKTADAATAILTRLDGWLTKLEAILP